MQETWKKYEGQVVDGQLTLGQYIGGTGTSADFLVQIKGTAQETAVVKLVTAEAATADTQLSLWDRAARLSHRHLLRVLRSGRCRIAGTDLLYVVMERAEEDLAQILQQRALTAEEVREMLVPVLDALGYLHANGLVHGHLKPSNVLATGDQVKLSVDSILSIGAMRPGPRKPDVYDAPETASAPVSAASDMWSLGVTLVDALTQHPPTVHPKQDAEPILPKTIPQPFVDIAHHTVIFEPDQRWTAVDIAAHLKSSGTAVAASAGATPSTAPATAKQSPTAVDPCVVPPLSVPLSPERAIPAAKLPKQPPKAAPVYAPPRPHADSAARETVTLPNYVIPSLAVVFLLVAIYALPKILHRQTEPASSAAAEVAPAVATQKQERTAAKKEAPAGAAVAKESSKKVAEKKPTEEGLNTLDTSPAPASLRSKTFSDATKMDSSNSAVVRGEVLDQVLPDVPGKARDTIQGRIRVEVAVHVDAAGNVSEVELVTPGPSRYFADLAMKAARKWQFSSPEVNGRSMPSEWLIRFEYTQTNTQAIPKQTAP